MKVYSSTPDGSSDDLSFDGANLEEIFFDMDGMIEDPEVLFNEEDLSELYDINIPVLSSNSSDLAPMPISIPDLQAISSDLSYFFLRDKLGLSEDTMWKITNEAGSVLGMKASTVRKKVEVLKISLILSDEELRRIITSFPTLLHLSAENNIAPKILFLLAKLDMDAGELKKIIIGCPSVLGYSKANLDKKLSFLIETMGYSKKECKGILLKAPRILTSSAETGLLPRFLFLSKEIHIPESDIRKIVKKMPEILMMSVEQNLQPKIVFYLIMTLYMELDEVRKLLLSYPQILSYNMENHIQPITRQFLSFDFSAYEFSRMLLKFPRLLTYSVTKVRRVVGYLRFVLGLEASDVRRVLYQSPQVVSLKIENLQQKVDYIVEVAEPGAVAGHPSSKRILRKLIARMPTLLHLNVETNLKPKVDFLREKIGQEEFSEAIYRLPTLLGYSLENRIKPRLLHILEAGVDGGSITVGIPMTQVAFEKWLNNRIRKKAKEEQKISREQQETDEKGRIRENDGRVVHWVRKD